MGNNKSYIRGLAELIRAKINPSLLPEEATDELFDSYAVLALAKGEKVTDEDVHNAWSSWATKFDPSNKSLVPFDQLPADVRQEDNRFTTAIREIAKTLE